MFAGGKDGRDQKERLMVGAERDKVQLKISNMREVMWEKILGAECSDPTTAVK